MLPLSLMQKTRRRAKHVGESVASVAIAKPLTRRLGLLDTEKRTLVVLEPKRKMMNVVGRRNELVVRSGRIAAPRRIVLLARTSWLVKRGASVAVNAKGSSEKKKKRLLRGPRTAVGDPPMWMLLGTTRLVV
jgi:hypothetical protein